MHIDCKDSLLQCCSAWSCHVPCLALRRRMSKHGDSASLGSRTSPQLQLPGSRGVPHVVPVTGDVPAALLCQAQPSGAPPGSLCHTSIPPYQPSLQLRIFSPLILLSVHFGGCDKSCCHQGVPFHLQWEVVAVPSLPFQWVRNSIGFPWAPALGIALERALGRAPSPALGGCWCREFSPAAGTKAAQTADVDSKSLSFPLSGQAPGRIWFTTCLTCIYEQESSSHSLGTAAFVKNARGVFMSPITGCPH